MTDDETTKPIRLDLNDALADTLVEAIQRYKKVVGAQRADRALTKFAHLSSLLIAIADARRGRPHYTPYLALEDDTFNQRVLPVDLVDEAGESCGQLSLQLAIGKTGIPLLVKVTKHETHGSHYSDDFQPVNPNLDDRVDR